VATSLLQWALPLLVTVLIAFVGWRQWRINRQDQLDLRFYDKRKEIYEAIMEFLRKAVRTANVTQEDLNNLARRTKDARHLFDKNTNEVITLIYKRGVNVMVGHGMMDKDTPPNQDQMEAYTKGIKWFTELIDTLPAQFDRYLKVKK
jgi:hypothetical protein